MLEWILRLVSAILGRESAAQQRKDDEQHHRDVDTRENFKTLKDAYNDLMKNYQVMAQELRKDIETLRDEVASLASALERERTEHKECRRQLAVLTAEIKQLKGRVDVMQQKGGEDGGS
jgi:chromosome segregation ATPase